MILDYARIDWNKKCQFLNKLKFQYKIRFEI
jgi:hypothetical protein